MEEITNIFEVEFSEPVVTDIDNESNSLMELLKEFDMVNLLPYLKDADISFMSLKYLRNEDLKEVIPSVGQRAEFREKLFEWRKKEFGIDHESLSMPLKDCLQNSKIVSSSFKSSFSFDKNLKDLLMETSKGKAVLFYYEKENGLSDSKRNDIIIIIVEDVLFSGKNLSPRDFSNLVESICTLFPTEKNAQEYYFIPRRGKKNPSGKLYSKYVNMNSKKKKLGNNFAVSETRDAPDIIVEFDDVAANVLKDFLRKERENWSEIVDKWEKSFILRKIYAKNMSMHSLLTAWPLLKDSRFPNLVDIDFKLLHPYKNDLITLKWESFKDKIHKFYEDNLKNEFSKQLFKIAKSSTNKNTQDYITCTLLNAVLKPKHHFLVHYPSAIKLCGPLKSIWGMRFEAKHKEAKMYFNNIASRKNPPHSLAIKSGLKFSKFLLDHENGIEPEISFDSYKTINLKNEPCFPNIVESELLQYDNIKHINELIYRGFSYESNSYLFIHTNLFQLHKIESFLQHNENIYVLCFPVILNKFDEHFQSYEVGERHTNLHIKNIKTFSGPPLHLYTINNAKTYVRPKYF